VILLDIMMPDMDGYEVCQRLKENPKTQHIPVIFVSAMDETLDKIKAFRTGGSDYITKPFQIEEVLVRIENQLAVCKLQRQLQIANATLEQRVEKRTTELAQANARLIELNTAYESFIPRAILRLLQKEDITQVRLGDQIQQEMTIMFADIRSFTSLSETMSPQENFHFLNSYLHRVSPIIRQYEGFIDNYMGDAIMALFQGYPEDGLQAAIEIQQEVARYNAQRVQEGLPPIHVGAGLHTGSVMVGIIGEDQRKQGTVISDAVNTTARLEGLTKMYGASIVVSDRILFTLDPLKYSFRFLGKVIVKGKKNRVSVFEILDGCTQEEKEAKLQTQDYFEKGLLHYNSGGFAQAEECFLQVLSVNPQDEAARLYCERAIIARKASPFPSENEEYMELKEGS
jgi:two-component system sensor histidine kinase ChiS